jgi:FkbM family methyltransferase
MALGVAGGATGVYAWDRLGWRRMMPPDSRLSFSQQGEDIILFHALRDLFKLDRPTYLDVGAAHPVRSNNTYLLYGTGSRGVLVEPNPMFVKMLRADRPGDKVVAAGIGVTETAEADYYEIKDNPELNTFSPQQVEMLQRGKTESVVERVVKMPLININRVIAEHLGSAPDLLSTDIEGLDADIIRSLDLNRFRPAVICCEGVAYFGNGVQSEICKFLTPQGYVSRGGSMINSVFVDARRLKETS